MSFDILDGGAASGGGIPDKYRFIDDTARDAHFAAHLNELRNTADKKTRTLIMTGDYAQLWVGTDQPGIYPIPATEWGVPVFSSGNGDMQAADWGESGYDIALKTVKNAHDIYRKPAELVGKAGFVMAVNPAEDSIDLESFPGGGDMTEAVWASEWKAAGEPANHYVNESAKLLVGANPHDGADFVLTETIIDGSGTGTAVDNAAKAEDSNTLDGHSASDFLEVANLEQLITPYSDASTIASGPAVIDWFNADVVQTPSFVGKVYVSRTLADASPGSPGVAADEIIYNYKSVQGRIISFNYSAAPTENCELHIDPTIDLSVTFWAMQRRGPVAPMLGVHSSDTGYTPQPSDVNTFFPHTSPTTYRLGDTIRIFRPIVAPAAFYVTLENQAPVNVMNAEEWATGVNPESNANILDHAEVANSLKKASDASLHTVTDLVRWAGQDGEVVSDVDLKTYAGEALVPSVGAVLRMTDFEVKQLPTGVKVVNVTTTGGVESHVGDVYTIDFRDLLAKTMAVNTTSTALDPVVINMPSSFPVDYDDLDLNFFFYQRRDGRVTFPAPAGMSSSPGALSFTDREGEVIQVKRPTQFKTYYYYTKIGSVGQSVLYADDWAAGTGKDNLKVIDHSDYANTAGGIEYDTPALNMYQGTEVAASGTPTVGWHEFPRYQAADIHDNNHDEFHFATAAALHAVGFPTPTIYDLNTIGNWNVPASNVNQTLVTKNSTIVEAETTVVFDYTATPDVGRFVVGTTIEFVLTTNDPVTFDFTGPTSRLRVYEGSGFAPKYRTTNLTIKKANSRVRLVITATNVAGVSEASLEYHEASNFRGQFATTALMNAVPKPIQGDYALLNSASQAMELYFYDDTATVAAWVRVGGSSETHFKGEYATLGALQAAYPTASAGDYAHVNTAGNDPVTYFWDDDDTQWAESTGSTSHSHANKTVLDSISQGDIDNWNAAEANVQSDWNAGSGDALILNKPDLSDLHSHTNKALLDTYTQTESNLSDAVSKKHDHANQAALDNLTQGVVDDSHSHSNQSILDATTASFLIADESKLDGIDDDAQKLFLGNFPNVPGLIALHPTANSGEYALVGTPDPVMYVWDGNGAEWSKVSQQVNSDWDAVVGDAEILNKPTIPDEETGASIKSKLNGVGEYTLTSGELSDVQAIDQPFTTEEQGKLSGIGTGAQKNFLGNYPNGGSLTAAHPSPDAGSYALVGTVAPMGLYVWDSNNSVYQLMSNHDGEANVQSDWNAASGDAHILNKPAIPAAQVSSDWDSEIGVSQILNKPSIPNADEWVSTIEGGAPSITMTVWKGTQAQYDSITIKSATRLYLIV